MPMDTITTNSSSADEKTLADSGFYWREKDGVKVLVSKRLEKAGFVNGFSTRGGGVSEFPKDSLNLAGYDDDSPENIAENRRRFLKALGVDYRLASCWQIHSDLIRVVKDFEDAADGDYKMDAVVSATTGVLAGVKTADCVPILIGDPSTGAFAAIHAGWRGTVQSIAAKAIERMKEEYGSDPCDFIAAIGPAAGCRSYEIGGDVIDAFAQNFPHSAHLFNPTREGHALIDLHQANFEQLVSAGVKAENISVAPFCTMERTDLFFSYRVESKKGKTGRLMSAVGKSSR